MDKRHPACVTVGSVKPGRLTLIIVQGATFRRRFVWKAPRTVGGQPQARDLTGCAGRAQVRVGDRVALTFDSAPGADGTITFGADGVIELVADADVVARATAGSGSWSLEVQEPAGDRVVLLQGQATIQREITR